MTLPEFLSAVEQRIEKATPGEWTLDPRNLCFYEKDGTLKKLDNELCLSEDSQNGDHLGACIDGPIEPSRGTFVVRDAWLIANAKSDLAKLVRLVRKLREQRNEALETDWNLVDTITHKIKADQELEGILWGEK